MSRIPEYNISVPECQNLNAYTYLQTHLKQVGSGSDGMPTPHGYRKALRMIGTRPGHVSEMAATEKTASVLAGIWKLHDTKLLAKTLKWPNTRLSGQT
nr:hypothetical protein [Tanacetum cinerariifolium]